MLINCTSVWILLKKTDSASTNRSIQERKTKPILTRFKNIIVTGDFFLVKEDVLSNEELAVLKKYKEAYKVLGKDRPVSVEVLAKICRVLDCTIYDIVEILPDTNNEQF